MELAYERLESLSDEISSDSPSLILRHTDSEKVTCALVSSMISLPLTLSLKRWYWCCWDLKCVALAFQNFPTVPYLHLRRFYSVRGPELPDYGATNMRKNNSQFIFTVCCNNARTSEMWMNHWNVCIYRKRPSCFAPLGKQTTFQRDFKVVFCIVIGEFLSMFCQFFILDRCYDNDKCQRVTKSQVWP